jgi:hypothetical protein
MINKMDCNSIAAIGTLWGMFIGTFLGCSLRLYVDHNYPTADEKRKYESDIDALESFVEDKDAEIREMQEKMDRLTCDEDANDLLIAKLKNELLAVTDQMYDQASKVSVLESVNRIYRTELQAIQNLHRTPARGEPVPPPNKIRKRYRSSSDDGNITPPRYTAHYFDNDPK